MKTKPNLDDLLEEESSHVYHSHLDLPPDVAEARRKEQVRRASRAQYLTAKAMRRLHREDWLALMAQARTKVDAECGPLPGDPK